VEDFISTYGWKNGKAKKTKVLKNKKAKNKRKGTSG